MEEKENVYLLDKSAISSLKKSFVNPGTQIGQT